MVVRFMSMVVSPVSRATAARRRRTRYMVASGRRGVMRRLSRATRESTIRKRSAWGSRPRGVHDVFFPKPASRARTIARERFATSILPKNAVFYFQTDGAHHDIHAYITRLSSGRA